MANTWQGAFPLENLKTDGYARTSPVTAFPPNGYGLYDMIGNVWEWTTDWYSDRHEVQRGKFVLRRGQEPARRQRGTQLRFLPAEHPHPAQGSEGRVAPLRAQLLSALPSRGAACRAGRYLDQPRRISLRDADERSMTSARPSRSARILTWLAVVPVGRAARLGGRTVRMVDRRSINDSGATSSRANERTNDLPVLPATDHGLDRRAARRHPRRALRAQGVFLDGSAGSDDAAAAGCAKAWSRPRASCCSGSAWM